MAHGAFAHPPQSFKIPGQKEEAFNLRPRPKKASTGRRNSTTFRSCCLGLEEDRYPPGPCSGLVTTRLLVGLVVVVAVLATIVAAASPSSTTHIGAPSPLPLSPLPLRPHPGASSPAYYEQEGATVSSLNGKTTFGFTSVYTEVTLQSSPYSTAYELNGLSNSGDWYQATVGDNWPGCPGFAPLFEYWANNQTSSAPVCYPGFTLSAGEQVILGLTISTTQVCMSVTLVSGAASIPYCVTPPNAGGTAFIPLQTAANSNGYFTGPMTEVVDVYATSCLAYTGLPEISYGFAQGAYISSFVAWSDEFNTSGAICYGHETPVISEPPGSSLPIYVEATNGSIYGPHWESAQNVSGSSVSISWNFSTDSPPLVLSVGRQAADVGQQVVLGATAETGTAPISYSFWINGTLASTGPGFYDWIPTTPGTYSIQVTARNPGGSLNYTSPNATVVVSPRPVAGPIERTGGPRSLDAGMSLLLSLNVSGGSGGLVVSWFGLPSFCLPFSTQVRCTNVTAGAYAIYAEVTDSNGVSVYSNATFLRVQPSPEVTLFESALGGALGQNVTFIGYVRGGTAPLTFAWSGLPSGCQTLNGSSFSEVQCVPRTSGTLNVLLTVTDADYESSVAAIHYNVTGSPNTLGNWLDNNWLTVFLVALVVLFAALLMVSLRRRRPPPPNPPGPWQRPPIAAGFAPIPVPGGSGPSPEWDEHNVPPYWEVPPPLQTHCRRCEYENAPGSRYCARCGIPLGGEEPAPAHTSP